MQIIELVYKTLDNPVTFSSHFVPWVLLACELWAVVLYPLCSSSMWYLIHIDQLELAWNQKLPFLFQWATKLVKILWDSAAQTPTYSSHAHFPVEKN